MHHLFPILGAKKKDGGQPVRPGLYYIADHLLNEQGPYYYRHRWPGFASWVSEQYWLEIEGHSAYQPAEPHPYPLNLNCDFAVPSVHSDGTAFARYIKGPVQSISKPYAEIDNHPIFTLLPEGSGFTVDLRMRINQITDDDSQRSIALFNITHTAPTMAALSLCMRRHKDTGVDDFWLALLAPNGLETKTPTYSFTKPEVNPSDDPFNIIVTAQNGLYSIKIDHPWGNSRQGSLSSSNQFLGGGEPKLHMFHAREKPEEEISADLFHLKIDALGGI